MWFGDGVRGGLGEGLGEVKAPYQYPSSVAWKTATPLPRETAWKSKVSAGAGSGLKVGSVVSIYECGCTNWVGENSMDKKQLQFDTDFSVEWDLDIPRSFSVMWSATDMRERIQGLQAEHNQTPFHTQFHQLSFMSGGL